MDELERRPADAEPNPPIAIDLPDGQRLVLGQLPEGVAIEVATWHGTGAPGADAHRLLLGVSTGVEVEPSAAAKAVTEQRWQELLGGGSTPVETEEVPRLRRGRPWLVAVAAVGALVAVLAALGVRVVHPSSGLATSLSSADSSVAVTVPVGTIEQGDIVILVTPDGPVLGAISEVYGDEILVSTGGGFAQAKAGDVYGRLLFVVPFIGSALSAIGL